MLNDVLYVRLIHSILIKLYPHGRSMDLPIFVLGGRPALAVVEG
jgi:hypothetical protein